MVTSCWRSAASTCGCRRAPSAFAQGMLYNIFEQIDLAGDAGDDD
jgi:hypothetical protein